MKKRYIETKYGTVSGINYNGIKKIKKKKINLTGVLVLTAAGIILITSMITKPWKKNEYNPKEGQIKTYITMQVESGDTVSEIARKLYTEESEEVYNSVKAYEREIQEENHIGSNIDAGDTLKIPVIVDENNEYYLQIKEIEKQIKEIEKNNLWVRYTVQYGDRISTIAALASGDHTEVIDIANEIANKNHIKNPSLLQSGDEIWIMNPYLGELKKELQAVEKELINSLSNNVIKK